nr:MAG TPA: hypothetical protein [Bacteriophage sp.]
MLPLRRISKTGFRSLLPLHCIPRISPGIYLTGETLICL